MPQTMTGVSNANSGVPLRSSRMMPQVPPVRAVSRRIPSSAAFWAVLLRLIPSVEKCRAWVLVAPHELGCGLLGVKFLAYKELSSCLQEGGFQGST